MFRLLRANRNSVESVPIVCFSFDHHDHFETRPQNCFQFVFMDVACASLCQFLPIQLVHAFAVLSLLALYRYSLVFSHSSVNANVPQDSVLGPLLYLLYTADLPASSESATATFADDTAVVTMDSDPAIASQKLQTDLLAIQNWFKKWRMKANESKSIHLTFTTRRETCPRSI
jgi:hypothetical protein